MARVTSCNGKNTRQLKNYNGLDASDDDEDTFSLPPFSNSVRLQVDAARKSMREQALEGNISGSTGNLIKSTSVTSLKEFEDKLNRLGQENFNLKLRLYYLEKNKNGITRPEVENAAADELCRKDQLIRALEKQLEDRSDEINSLRSSHQSALRLKDLEMERIKNERDQLHEQLDLLRSKRENMGQAISRQLKKIEELLETTSMYVQEIN